VKVVKGRKAKIDVASFGGLLLGAGCILAAQLLEGGSPRSIVHLTAAVIVFGGTIGATLVSFPRAQVGQAVAALRSVFREREDDAAPIAEALVRYARVARAHGMMALDEHADRQPDALLQKALRLAVDGTEARHLRQIVALEISNDEERNLAPARVFEALGGYAPTFGIVGAVLGLIHVMENLSEPGSLGAGIATAFVATVYGVGAANLVFLPMASKLRDRAERTAVRGEMILEGVLAIQEGLSPRLVEEKLLTYRPATSARAGRVGRAA
jgi:chemotaxis protein MotA